jgi:hypothetical protein
MVLIIPENSFETMSDILEVVNFFMPWCYSRKHTHTHWKPRNKTKNESLSLVRKR